MDRAQGQIRRSAALALVGGFVVLFAGPSQALTYHTGDVIAVLSKNATELDVDLGSLSSLKNGQQFTFGTPSAFGSTGALGGAFVAFQTQSPFTGNVGQNVTFSTATTVHPTTFDNNFTQYVSQIGNAQVSIDDGFGDGYSPNLNSFPAAGQGGVIINDTTRLAIPDSVSSSYLNTIGLGTNQINGALPFSISDSLGANGHVIDLWTGKVTNAAGTTSTTTLLGTLTVDGNETGNGSQIRITFSAVPEPSTLLLFVAGLSGLAGVAGRMRRRSQS